MGFVERLNIKVAESAVGRWFKLEGSSHPNPRADTRFSTEIRAGFATFVTMAYIISVNSLIISDTGGPCVCAWDGVTVGAGQTKIDYCSVDPDYQDCVGIVKKDLIVATAAMACIASTAIGLFSNLPLGMAPGMGINAYFTYTVVGKYGTGPISYQTALAAVFIEGMIFLVLSIFGLRQWLARSIPRNIKVATGVGIGLYLCFIGMQSSAGIGLIRADPATLVTLGGCPPEYVDATGACISHTMQSATTWVGIMGLFMISILVLYKVKGAILIGILFVAIISWFRGTAITYFPYDAVGNARFDYFKQVVSFHTIQKTLAVMNFDFSDGQFWLALFTLLYVDILDTTGTMFSMAQYAGFMDPKTGDFEGSTPAFITDALCVSLGSVFGTSDVTAFVESGAGISEGGRTGITAMMVGFCFFISLFFSPIFSSIPPWATGPALIFVGSLMTKSVTEINFSYIGDSIPAFLTLAMMPLTYNIAYGLIGGLMAAVVINGTVWLVSKLSRGKWMPPNMSDKDPGTSFRMGAYGDGVLPPWMVRLIKKIKGIEDPVEEEAAENGQQSYHPEFDFEGNPTGTTNSSTDIGLHKLKGDIKEQPTLSSQQQGQHPLETNDTVVLPNTFSNNSTEIESTSSGTETGRETTSTGVHRKSVGQNNSP